MSAGRFLCSICLDLFTDPVSTPCGHNFCQTCISRHWDSNVLYDCPLCKEQFSSRPRIRINTFIREMVDQFRHEAQQAAEPEQVPCDLCTGTKLKALKSCLVCLASYCQTHLEPHLTASRLKRHQLVHPVDNLEDRMCSEHDKPLELFCKTDQTCVCSLCPVLDHKTHEFVPLREECEGKKAELRNTEAEVQLMIQNRQLKIQEIKESVKMSTAAADREKAEGLQVFTDLMDSVERNKKSFMKEMEDKQKTTEKQAEDLIKDLEQEISELMKRSSEVKRVQRFEVDLTLDPKTAHPKLVLSADGKQVHCGDEWKKLPDNPERFSMYAFVLGTQSFSSGRFYFEVQVEGKTEWDLGMARKSINRKGVISWSPQNAFWTIWLRNRNEYMALADPWVHLGLDPGPERVGVFVDHQEGLVSFYDVDAAALIYSFTGCCFTEELYLLFYPGPNHGGENSAPLIICPVNQSP